MRVHDILDLIQVGQSSYRKFREAINSSKFDVIGNLLIELRLLTTCLLDGRIATFIEAHDSVEEAWTAFFTDADAVGRQLDRTHVVGYKSEYERFLMVSQGGNDEKSVRSKSSKSSRASIPSMSGGRSTSSSIDSRRSKGSKHTSRSAARSRKSDTSRHVRIKDERAPDMPTVVTVTSERSSNISENTKAIEDATKHSEAFTALRDSMVTKPAEKPMLRTMLNHRIKWDGQERTFPLFREGYESYLLATGQRYIWDSDFRKAYINNDANYPVLRAKYGVSVAQVQADAEAQYGMLKGACKEGREVLKQFTTKYADGIKVWDAMLHWYQYGGSVTTAMSRLLSRLEQPFTESYSGGVARYVTMISNTYAEMEEVIKDHPGCNESVPIDGSRMTLVLHKFVGTRHHSAIYDIHAQCVAKGSSFQEFVEMIRNKFASEDQSDMKGARRQARHVNTAYDHEALVQAFVANMSPLHLSSELLKLMRSMNPEFAQEFLSKRDEISKERRERERTASTTPGNALPKQYSGNARQANMAAGLSSINEEPPVDNDGEIKALSTETIDENDTLSKFALLVRLAHANVTQNDDEESDDDGHVTHANPTFTIRGDYEREVSAMNAQSNGQHHTISDGGADTWILGCGWRVLSQTQRFANVVGFDSNYAKKKQLPIVVAAAVTKNDLNEDVLLVVFEGVHNADSNVSLMSEYQTRETGNMIDSVARHHKHPDGSDGGQQMRLIQPMDGSSLAETTIPLHIRNALMTFPHREPTDDELKSLPRFLMTPRTAWIPPNHVSDKDILPVANDNHQAACLIPSPGSVDSEPPLVAAIGATERGVTRHQIHANGRGTIRSWKRQVFCVIRSTNTRQ
jgi:hypothetical protein